MTISGNEITDSVESTKCDASIDDDLQDGLCLMIDGLLIAIFQDKDPLGRLDSFHRSIAMAIRREAVEQL